MSEPDGNPEGEYSPSSAGTAVSYNTRGPLANYCKSEEIFFKSDTKHDLQVNSSNLGTEDKQICIKVSTSYIAEHYVSDININQ